MKPSPINIVEYVHRTVLRNFQYFHARTVAESEKYGRSHACSPPVLSAVEAARRGNQKIEAIDLSEEYLKAAGGLARVRSAFAAHRLAAILHEGL